MVTLFIKDETENSLLLEMNIDKRDLPDSVEKLLITLMQQVGNTLLPEIRRILNERTAHST